MGSQRTSVTLRNVACVPSFWLLSSKEATTLPRSQRRGFLFIEVRLMVPVDVRGRVRDIYIVQDHQLSEFYVLACILSIHWAVVYRPLKALKYGKLRIKCTFFWNLFNHTLTSNTNLFVIKDNYLTGGVVTFYWTITSGFKTFCTIYPGINMIPYILCCSYRAFSCIL
jgi:hypothetical protein